MGLQAHDVSKAALKNCRYSVYVYINTKEMIFVAQKTNFRILRFRQNKFYKKTPSNRKGTDGVRIFDCMGVNLTEGYAAFWRSQAMLFHWIPAL